MTTWETYNLPEQIIKNELCLGTSKKDGEVVGVYYRKNHPKKFYYRKRNKKERAIAKNKALDLIRRAYWKKVYVVDFPEPTAEFIYLIKNLDFEKVYKTLDKVEIINGFIIDAKKNSYSSDQFPSLELVQAVKSQLNIVLELNENLPVYAYLWSVKSIVRKIFYESLESILDDQHSNYNPDGRGRERFVPKALERYIIDRDNGLCQHCGKVTKVTRVDHIIPVTLGGPSNKWNLQLLCRNCNQSKRDSLITVDIKKALLRLKKNIATSPFEINERC